MWTRELADILRETAKRVAGPQYRWSDITCCNAAMLVRSMMGISASELRRQWSMMDTYRVPKVHCGPWSETRLIGVFAARALELGLTDQDIEDLEGLCNPRIRERAGLPAASEYPGGFADKTDPMSVVCYILAWAAIIEEQLGPRPAVPVEAVPEKLHATTKSAVSQTAASFPDRRGAAAVLAT